MHAPVFFRAHRIKCLFPRQGKQTICLNGGNAAAPGPKAGGSAAESLMASDKAKKNLAAFEVLLCGLMWSTGGIFIKLIPWNSFVIAGLRSLLSGLVAFIYLRYRHMRFIVSRRSMAAGAALGLTMTFFVAANKLTTAANAIVLQFTAPVFIIIISAVFLKKKFTAADVTAVSITMCGIALFFFDKLGSGSLLGNCVALLAGVSFGCYYITLGESPQDERLSGIVIADILTFVIGIPFIFTTGPVLSGLPLLWIFLLGVFQLGIPYVLLSEGSEYCPPLLCALLGAVEPLFNPVWVYIFDGEAPGAFALAGGVIVIVTITGWCMYNGRRTGAASD